MVGGKTTQCSAHSLSDFPAVAATPNNHRDRAAVVPSLASQEKCTEKLQPTRPGKYGFGERIPFGVFAESSPSHFRNYSLGMGVFRERNFCTPIEQEVHKGLKFHSETVTIWKVSFITFTLK